MALVTEEKQGKFRPRFVGSSVAQCEAFVAEMINEELCKQDRGDLRARSLEVFRVKGPAGDPEPEPREETWCCHSPGRAWFEDRTKFKRVASYCDADDDATPFHPLNSSATVVFTIWSMP